MISGIVILPYRLLNSEKGKNTMQVKNIISDFLQLRDKVNSELHFVGFLTKNGKRLITRTDSGSEIKVLTDLLKVLSYDKVYKEPFDIILSYFTDKGSITISDIGFFDNIQEAATWLVESAKFENQQSSASLYKI